MGNTKDKHQYIIVWEDEITEDDVIVKFDELNNAFAALRSYSEENPNIKHTLYTKLIVNGLS